MSSSIGRTLKIFAAVLEYLVLYKITRHRKESLGARLRGLCEELGLVFVKLGQILSTRYDLLGRSDCEELQNLLDDAPPMSRPEVAAVFEEDFGRTPEEVFESFSWQPLASASVSQVHRASLPDGRQVAVKIRRPDLDEIITSDLKIFRFVARLGHIFSPTLRHINLMGVIDEMEQWLRAEVDFEREKNNVGEFKKFYDSQAQFAGHYASNIVFPDVYLDFCSRQVLTLEFLEGVPAKRFKEVAENPEYNPRLSLESFIRAVLRVWMYGEELIFHGDPHPSNVLLMKDGRLGLLDLGLLGRLKGRELKLTRDLFLAVYSKDVELTIRYSLALSGASHPKYASLIREEIKEYLEETRASGMGFWFLGILNIFIKHRISIPHQMVLFCRMQILIDGLFETVLPGSTTLDILGEELQSALRRRVWSNLKEMNFFAMAYIVTEKMKKSPEGLAAALDKYMDNPLEFISDLSKAVQGSSDFSKASP